MNIEQSIRELIINAIAKNAEFKHLKEDIEINIECPKNKQFGDLSSNIALELGKRIGKQPLEIAQTLAAALRQEISSASFGGRIARIEVKQPGFINFFFSRHWLYEILLEIKKRKNNFGRINLGQGKRVNIEFVSANPTGPLNVAHGRQAAFGDTLANILQFCGYRLTREYYLNDEGVQIDILGESVRVKYLGLLGISAPFPENGYRGKYIDDLAKDLVERYGHKYAKEDKRHLAFFSNFAIRNILKGIKKDLTAFGVNFDSWFSQKKLNASGKITKALALLKKRGFIYEKEAAQWLVSTRFGDDKDRVVVKSDGSLTYISPDIAYHQSKFRRGFAKMINIWGPDHHGYIARLKAAITALGYNAERVAFLIVQLVSLFSAEKVIPMSTRMGQYVSLDDIIQAVGKDAARFFFLMRRRDAHLNFDLELAKKQSLENPVYYIQYAHARINNILKYAQGSLNRKINFSANLNLSLLDKPEELTLIQTLSMFPAVVEFCASSLEPHRMTAYLQELAKDIHYYYEKHRVVTEDDHLTQVRLILIDAARIVLNNGLRLLAISAPEKM